MTRFGDLLYRLLLRAFPASFRRRHGDEMQAQFEVQRQLLAARPVALAALWVLAAADALWHGVTLRRVDAKPAHRSIGGTSTGGAAMALIEDLRFAIRGFRRDRSVTAVIVIILTAGIGANAIMFGVVDQLLLRPPSGVGHPDAVRRVHFGSERSRPGRTVAERHSYPFIAAIRDNVPAFSAAAATHLSEVTLGAGPDARLATAQLVDAAYFPLLELRPAAGRFFTREESSVAAAQPVAVLSNGFWRRAYAGNDRVIGQELRVEGQVLTIIGVGPSAFSGIDGTRVDIWIPIGTLAPTLLGERWASNPGRFAFGLVARLSADATPAIAAAQATVAIRSPITELPRFDRQATAFTAPLERLKAPNGILAEGKVGLWLLGVSAIVLLIAVANVASLLLTRTLARRREVAVRLALGISRRRLLGQLLTESALLCALASVAALAVAYGAGHLVQQVLLPGFAWSESVVDARVLAITLAIGTLTAVGAGLAPAAQAVSTDLLGSLRVSPRVTGGRTGLLRKGLLVAQVALCAVLLVGAGLFVKSLRALQAHDVGIDLDRVIQTVLPDRPGMRLAEIEALYAQAMERLGGIPGVERVTISRASAPMGISSATSILREGWTLSDLNDRPMPSLSVVSPDYFATLGASLERGRGLTAEDERSGARVAVINRALESDFWPDADPIGKCLRVGGGSPCTLIVGIVENILLFDRVNTERSQLYLPVSHPDAGSRRPRALLIRTLAEAGPLVPIVQRALQSLTPDMPYVPVSTMNERTAEHLQPWRLGTTMFVLFGGVALLISMIGLFSAMAHAVSQRGHEIGVRMALGASAWRVVVQIGRHGAAAVAVGTIAGLLVAGAASRWLSDLLYQTSPRDSVVFVTVAGILAVAGVAAAVVPARRSTRIDPLVVLKTE
jgi:putative ABC transport system permease protein